MSVTPYAAIALLLEQNGAPEESRTPNLLIRSLKFHISAAVLELDSLTPDPRTPSRAITFACLGVVTACRVLCTILRSTHERSEALVQTHRCLRE